MRFYFPNILYCFSPFMAKMSCSLFLIQNIISTKIHDKKVTLNNIIFGITVEIDSK